MGGEMHQRQGYEAGADGQYPSGGYPSVDVGNGEWRQVPGPPQQNYGGPPQQNYSGPPQQQLADNEYIDSKGRIRRKRKGGKLAAALAICWCCTWPCHGPCCGGL